MLNYLYCGLILISLITLVGVILPKLFLNCKYFVSETGDSGLKKINEENGMSILFEPSPSIKEYVPQYIISKRNNKKQMKCRIDESIVHIEYDVIVFDKFDKVIKVIAVKEDIENEGYTKTIDLPSKTAYVSLNLICANNLKFPKKYKTKFSSLGMTLFTIIQAILLAASIVALRYFIVLALGDVFIEKLLYSPEEYMLFLAIAGGALLLEVGLVILFLVRKSKEG